MSAPLVVPDLDAIAALARAGTPEPWPADASPPPRPHKGRGALTNPPNRFEKLRGVPDGWADPDEEEPRLATTLIRDRSRSAISWNESPDIGFDRSLNPYRGCEHGCIYCYARPSHAWLGYSPGLDFETKLVFKPAVAALLEKELRRPGYEPAPLALGTNTDPYQPVERRLRLTRAVLEVLSRYSHPVTITTKSVAVTRDLDLLADLAGRRLVRVQISLTTLDPRLASRMEPRAPSPSRRLAAMWALAEAGVPVGVMAAPMIPGLNDSELERLLEAAAAAGASYAAFILLRLPGEVAAMFTDWLGAHYPERARHVLALIRQTRAGALNDSRFHERFRGSGAYAETLAARFAAAARRFKLDGAGMELDRSRFVRPAPARSLAEAQLALF